VAGSGTVLADDPALTARPGGAVAERQPVRVILDAAGRVPASAAVFSQPGSTVVATTDASGSAWREAMTGAGAEVLLCEPSETGVSRHQLLRALGRRGVLTAWFEGGPTVLGSLFDEDLADEVWAFIAPLVLGGEGRPAVLGHGADIVSAAPRLR